MSFIFKEKVFFPGVRFSKNRRLVNVCIKSTGEWHMPCCVQAETTMLSLNNTRQHLLSFVMQPLLTHKSKHLSQNFSTEHSTPSSPCSRSPPAFAFFKFESPGYFSREALSNEKTLKV